MIANQNLVLSPQPVSFTLAVPGAPDVRRTETSKDGVAWTRLDSSRRAGAAQFVASSGAASVRRVVQEVASDPCNIRMHAERAKDGAIAVADGPYSRLRGKPGSGRHNRDIHLRRRSSGRSTVDARIKRGIAQAELPASRQATISVAAGVVIGNEIRWGGGQ